MKEMDEERAEYLRYFDLWKGLQDDPRGPDAARNRPLMLALRSKLGGDMFEQSHARIMARVAQIQSEKSNREDSA